MDLPWDGLMRSLPRAHPRSVLRYARGDARSAGPESGVHWRLTQFAEGEGGLDHNADSDAALVGQTGA